MLPLNQNITVNTGDTITTGYGLTMPGTHGGSDSHSSNRVYGG